MTKQDIVSKIVEIPEDTLMKQLSELFEYINSWDTWTKLKQADPDKVAVVYSISEDFYKTEEINSRIINNISGASFIPKEVGGVYMNQELYNELTLDKLFIYQLYQNKLVHRLTEDINDSNGRLKIIDRGLKNMRDKICSEYGIPVSLFYKARGSSYIFLFFSFVAEEYNITFEEFITFETSDNEYAQNFRNILNKLKNHNLFRTGYQNRSINMRTRWRGLSLSEQMYLINIDLYNTYKDFIRALRDFAQYLHRQRHGENEE